MSDFKIFSEMIDKFDKDLQFKCEDNEVIRAEIEEYFKNIREELQFKCENFKNIREELKWEH